ncbi:MAG: tRNA (adenosine(37)-N6)-threonylcarbamoyltransferase complex ATPase subunit type 1 TsaE [Eubacteriales bacterium]|nr:tRNA (adenosine(37)-N6)-threonylcarbamoyltransferase complex ATPase subunit type 1 TsaE [Eubacteriales bacterium]
MKKEVFSVEETNEFAIKMAQNSKKGNIYCISGDLGTGKTHFSKAFAKGLGIKEEITSPTFTIVNEYRENEVNFFHFDVYRINSIEEMYDIGYEEYFFADGICLIEWAELIEPIIPKGATWIKIEKDISKGEDYRVIEVIEK